MIFRTVSYRDGVPGAGGRVNKSEWVCPYDEKNPDNGPALRFYGQKSRDARSCQKHILPSTDTHNILSRPGNMHIHVHFNWIPRVKGSGVDFHQN
ncbi:hypothetical protein GEV33_007356 [Tenebrio molitor]|uniref:Uncharacterized protein n=1 Tax=Tenebrio molitor TaxID=7067 RepID=A0A8J6HIT6_TENMO|nr:hypothetical protein GEV33_007356 [Tenebrio molitor]